MPESRCDLILLGWTAFVGFNLISDLLWGTGRAVADGTDQQGVLASGAAELYRGQYRLSTNGSLVEEGTLHLNLGSQATAIMSVQVSTMTMGLRRSGTRSSFDASYQELAFAGLEMATPPSLGALLPALAGAGGEGSAGGEGGEPAAMRSGRIVATGAAANSKLRSSSGLCRLTASVDLKMPDPDLKVALRGSSSGGSGGVATATGEVIGQSCGIALAFAAEAVDIVSITQKVVHYSVWVNILTILQMRAFLAQIKYSDDGPHAGKVSIACIAMQALMDAYDSFLHLCLGLSSQYMFNTIAVISLFKFILFSLLEARYLLIIWRHRQPEIFALGWDAVRRELSWLYSRFYGILVLGLVFVYHNLDHLDVIVIVFQGYWLPQIALDAWMGSKGGLCKTFILGISATRSLLVLYLWGCPYGIYSGDLYPLLPGAPSGAMCITVIVFQGVQVGVMLLQRRWGARWFIPWMCMPWAYNYHRSSQVEAGTDCVICMGDLDPEDARRVITPCNHKFHEACLEQWMDVKMECPTCRAALPPIQ